VTPTLVVFTAVIGLTEPLRAPRVVAPRVRYLCFSDAPCDVPPYEWIPVPETDEPRKVSRQIKILADHPILRAADMTLWHDASYQLRRDPAWVVRRLHKTDVVALRHQRESLEEEARRVARYGYVELDAALATVARYRQAGFDPHHLTAGGLLGRRTTDAVRRFNELWWKESQTYWGGRDQPSLNFCAWKAGVTVGHVHGRIKKNVYAGWRSL
jgi:hypothetical protein